MRPGATALRRMPYCAHSTASVCVRLTTPARAALLCAGREAAPEVYHDADNGSAVLAHPVTHDSLRHVEGAGQVGLDHSLPASRRDLLHWREKLAARVIHQPIQPPEPLKHCLHSGIHLLLAANIARAGKYLPTRLLNLRTSLFHVLQRA